MAEKSIARAIAENIRLGLMEEVAPGEYRITKKGVAKVQSMIERKSHRTAKPIVWREGKTP